MYGMQPRQQQKQAMAAMALFYQISSASGSIPNTQSLGVRSVYATADDLWRGGGILSLLGVTSRLGVCDCHLSYAADRAVDGGGVLLEGGNGGGGLVVVSFAGVGVGGWLLGLLGLGFSGILGLVVGEAVAVLRAAGLGIWLLLHGCWEGREAGVREDGFVVFRGEVLESRRDGQEGRDDRWSL
jgi:hypothetical protein